ncbi:histidine kinase [uncultured Microbacterium sp.]|uniref:Signal transduction histidine kinase n=1 Tax=uncultured Microbacterium sp. TaxID=191216 RepID=A0A1Y5P712_9MICO|nr:histidine kinase [uncultured Microbacterium sp.]SBS74417.1 Signal transduction histidine kinase [uncultured Microbacterium sp.]
MPITVVERTAAALLAAEGVGLLVLLGWQIVAIVTGDTDSVASAVALIVLTALGAAAVLGFAVATWIGQSWGRSGGIVTQLLILAVALGAATGDYGHPAVAVALAVPAVVIGICLVAAARAAGGRRPAAE